MGGKVTAATGASGTVTLQGILQMRNQGMGWGRIANSLGFRLGSVVSAMKTTNARLSAQASVQAGGSAGIGTASDGQHRIGGGIATGAGAQVGVSGRGMVAGDSEAGAGHGIVSGASARASAGASGRGKVFGRFD